MSNIKQIIIDKVIEQMKHDIQIGDETAIDELLHNLSTSHLVGYLPEEDTDRSVVSERDFTDDLPEDEQPDVCKQ